MNIRSISKALNELSSTIQVIPLFSTTLIIGIGGLSVLYIISVLYFYQHLQDIIIYIFLAQIVLVIIHYLYMNYLSLRLRKRYDELQMFVEKFIDREL